MLYATLNACENVKREKQGKMHSTWIKITTHSKIILFGKKEVSWLTSHINSLSPCDTVSFRAMQGQLNGPFMKMPQTVISSRAYSRGKKKKLVLSNPFPKKPLNWKDGKVSTQIHTLWDATCKCTSSETAKMSRHVFLVDRIGANESMTGKPRGWMTHQAVYSDCRHDCAELCL